MGGKTSPRGGLLIWHVDTARCYNFNEKVVDLELAHGLWNWNVSACTTTTPNSVYGMDSLDLTCTYASPTFASATCWWNDSTKTNFDGVSNPTSDAYRDTLINGVRWQDVHTCLAVRNIHAGNLAAATADLLKNNWFGHIAQNVTWGPGEVCVTGDVTVDSGYTLTIDSNTIVYAQYNEDNQRAGADTNKIEIRVAKGGNLIVNGKPNFPVKFLSSRSEALASTEDWRGIVVKPGGYISINNAIIRHAYAGIEDSSRFLHTIKNVKIGRCQMYGILASNTDSLTIRGCRIDSVYGVLGGTGILVHSSSSSAGARLVKDTIRGCWYGIHIEASATPVESCQVVSLSGVTCNTGIKNQNQSLVGTSVCLPVSATSVSGSYTAQHFDNSLNGRVSVSGCSFVSSTGTRSPSGVRNADGDSLKLRSSEVLEWGTYGIITAHNGGKATNLGYSGDAGNNTIYTSASGSGWKYVYDPDCSNCGSPIIKAEFNQWYAWPPSSSRFSGNVDYNPYLLTPDPKVIAEKEKEVLPKRTTLYQNYPNPFNPTTLIQFELAKPERVNLVVYNILGQRVRTMLAGEEFAAGPYTFLWDGKDERGSPVSSGMYVYKLQTSTF